MRGGYVISDCDSTPDCLLISTGSEVECCIKAQQLLANENINARVVSLPCLKLFESQSEEYRESVIPSNVKARVCVEAGCSFGWHKYSGDNGRIISVDSFGESAPSDFLFQHLGFTAQNVYQKAKEILSK